MKLFKLSFSTIALSAMLFAGNYTIDKESSSADFSLKYLKTKDLNGSFKSINGSLEYDEKTAILKSLNGEILLDFVDTSVPHVDEILKSDKVFNTSKFPNMKFVATKIEEDTIFGNLTIKDVTRNIELDLKNSGVFFDKLYLQLSGKIKRSQFDLTWDELISTGSVAVSNDISIVVNIEANLKEEMKFTRIINKK